MTSYQVNYEGYYSMSSHDKEENALKRWFDNFKIDRQAHFATEFETLIVVEVPATAKHISKRQVCQIENPGYIKHKIQHLAGMREVVMDHTAPPAPLQTFAAKRIWQPPPPKSTEDLRKEAEYERMYRLGFEPIRRPKYSSYMDAINPFTSKDGALCLKEVEYEIEWVRRPRYDQQDAMRMAMMTMAPPAIDKSILRQLEALAPKHRRNN